MSTTIENKIKPLSANEEIVFLPLADTVDWPIPFRVSFFLTFSFQNNFSASLKVHDGCVISLCLMTYKWKIWGKDFPFQ